MSWKFDTLLKFVNDANTHQPAKEVPFQDLVVKWKEHHLSALCLTTQIRYRRALTGPLSFFDNFQVNDINPTLIDLWLDFIKKSDSSRVTRMSFKYELKLLKNLLTFYKEYYEVNSYDVPIRRRHLQKAQASSKTFFKSKEITLCEFMQFVSCLPAKLQDLAQIQYFQALRVSEVAALHWEDVHLNEEDPAKSYIKVRRSLKWINCQNAKLEDGFKNSKSHQGFKDLPLFPESYIVLNKLRLRCLTEGRPLTGFIFLEDTFPREPKRPFQYRKIQYFFDKAFRQAGLEYTGTHDMTLAF